MTDKTDHNILPQRCCGTCACFARMKADGSVSTDPAEAAQPSCRRLPPQLTMARVEKPLADQFGNPIRYTHGPNKGAPRMMMEQQPVLVYGPTLEQGVCFDGWRPIGTAPGEDWDKRPRRLSTAV